MRLNEIIETAAGKWPHRVALEHGADRISFGELHRLSDALARTLRGCGGTGAHIGILSPNGVGYAVGYFAAAKCGGVIVPLRAAHAQLQLEQSMRFADVQFVIASSGTARHLPECCNPLFSFEPVLKGAQLSIYRTQWDVGARTPSHSTDELALLLETSGSSRSPKHVMLSHHNVTSNMRAFLDAAGLTEDDRAIIALPLTSAGTNTTEFLAYVCSGITATLYPHAVFGVANYCKEVERRQATVGNVTPFILRMLLRYSAAATVKLRSIRKLFCASSPLGARVSVDLAERYPSIQFHYGYGLTEASPRCTMLDPLNFTAKAGSSGLPLRGIQVRVMRESSNAPAGVMGEILVRGSNVMLGYYKQPEKSADALRGGWLHTGDLGHSDSAGYLYVSGRRNNLILTRGYTVSPEEIEEVILDHPAVEDTQVIGLPDEMLFQRIVAQVVPRPGRTPTIRDLRSFLSARLPSWKQPAEIRLVTQLARSGMQKLVRQQPPEDWSEAVYSSSARQTLNYPEGRA